MQWVICTTSEVSKQRIVLHIIIVSINYFGWKIRKNRSEVITTKRQIYTPPPVVCVFIWKKPTPSPKGSQRYAPETRLLVCKISGLERCRSKSRSEVITSEGSSTKPEGCVYAIRKKSTQRFSDMLENADRQTYRRDMLMPYNLIITSSCPSDKNPSNRLNIVGLHRTCPWVSWMVKKSQQSVEY